MATTKYPWLPPGTTRLPLRPRHCSRKFHARWLRALIACEDEARAALRDMLEGIERRRKELDHATGARTKDRRRVNVTFEHQHRIRLRPHSVARNSLETRARRKVVQKQNFYLEASFERLWYRFPPNVGNLRIR